MKKSFYLMSILFKNVVRNLKLKFGATWMKNVNGPWRSCLATIRLQFISKETEGMSNETHSFKISIRNMALVDFRIRFTYIYAYVLSSNVNIYLYGIYSYVKQRLINQEGGQVGRVGNVHAF